MKHLLTSVAVVATLAFAAPAWAQGANQPPPPIGNPGGNAVGLPGPNPGGPGLTPYSGGAPTAPMPPPSAGTPPPNYETSATPPSHRYTRHPYHKTVTYRRGGKKGYEVTGSTANQLNQEELARLQAGNYSNPSAPSYPGSPPPGYSGSPPPSYSGSPPPSYSGSPPPSYPGAGAPPPPPPMGTTGGGAPYRP